MKFKLALALLILLSSCSFFNKKKHNRENSKEIAKVSGNFLYEKDMHGVFKGAPTRQDSELLRRNYINNWVKEQLIYQKALSNLTEQEKDKSAELDEYYHSLIKYAYLNKIVDQRLNRNVSDVEIESYYEQNKDVFMLHKCLVKLDYVVLPLKHKDISLLKKWFISSQQNDKDFLYQYCISKSIRFSLDPEKWFYFDELGKEIPTRTLDCTTISTNAYYELSDTNNMYMLIFREIKHEGETSPLKFEKERIREIILYKRRLDLIKAIEDEIYKEGLQKNYFKIYE